MKARVLFLSSIEVGDRAVVISRPFRRDVIPYANIADVHSNALLNRLTVTTNDGRGRTVQPFPWHPRGASHLRDAIAAAITARMESGLTAPPAAGRLANW